MDLDLNLLETFDALLQEQSVSRAAKRVGLSTPAMSHALARLRTTLGDEVLVRAGRNMVPTQRALALKEDVHTALAKARAVLSRQAVFEPRALQREFRVNAKAPPTMATPAPKMEALAELGEVGFRLP